MSEISSVQSIAKKLASRLLRKAEPVISRVGELAEDVFEREPRLKRASDYVQDVVFEKTGRVMPRIRASVQGKPIATTQRDLFRQLRDLPFDETKFQKKTTLDFLHRNILNLGNYDVKTISEISKLLKDLEKDPALEIILKRLPWDENVLATMNKLLSRNFSLDEMKTILNVSEMHRFDDIGNLLAIPPNQLENFKIIPILENTSAVDNNNLKNILSNPRLASPKMLDEIILQRNLDIAKNHPDLIEHVTKEYSPNVARRIERMRISLEGVQDEKIREFISSADVFRPDSEFNRNLAISKNYCISKGGMDELGKRELLLDAYLCNQDYYSMINGYTHDYYKALKKAFPESAEEISLDIQSNADNLRQSHKHLLANGASGIFHEAVRLEPIKEFIGRYSKDEPEMADYLYEKYFLTKMQNCELKRKCIEINKKFGTKVFVNLNTNATDLNKIDNELINWRDASSGKAKLPFIFDLSEIKEDFIKTGEIVTTGVSRRLDNAINMTSEKLSQNYADSTIRHEMTHLNDALFSKKDGIINGIDFDEIQQTQKYQTELAEAGIKGYSLKYAYQDKKEFIAVASTGDCSKYSEEFRDVLVKLGMPEWVFNLKSLHEY